MVSISFGGPADNVERALALRLPGSYAWQTRAPPGARAAPLREADPSTTWRSGGSNTRDRPKRHVALGSWQKA